MAVDGPSLPKKQDVALALLQSGTSVYVHLDPRSDEVLVPASFKKQPQLVLQVGLNMAVAIPDLDIGDDALTCTLSFNRRPEYCRVPWSAIFGLVGEDQRGMIWPDSIPKEVAAQAEGRPQAKRTPKAKRPKLRVAEKAAPQGASGSGPRGLTPSRTSSAKEAATEVREGASPALKKEANVAKKPRDLPPYLRVVK